MKTLVMLTAIATFLLDPRWYALKPERTPRMRPTWHWKSEDNWLRRKTRPL